MSMYLGMIDQEEVFNKLNSAPVIVNYLDISTPQGRLNLNELMYTKCEGDRLNTIPSCSCGRLTRFVNYGKTCAICHTVCQTSMDQELEPSMWLEAPVGVNTLINPAHWIVLSSLLTISGCNMLEWFCNPYYKAPGKQPDKLSALIDYMNNAGISRGINDFQRCIDDLFSEMFRLRMFPKKRREEVAALMGVIRDTIFTRWVPIPSEVGFIVEVDERATRVDEEMIDAVNAIRIINDVAAMGERMPLAKRQSLSVVAIAHLAKFYVGYVDKSIGSKPGFLRKHVYGSRLDFTARAVITSNAGVHDYDELIIPWGVALQLFQIDITNKLYRRGWSVTQVLDVFKDYALRYHPVLHEVIEELIAESPHRTKTLHKPGIACLYQRNPSLVRGSIQRMLITGVNWKETHAFTFITPVTAIKAFNADLTNPLRSLAA